MIGGELSDSGAILLDPLRERISRTAMPPATHAVSIGEARLKKWSSAWGAAALVLTASPTLRAKVQALTVGDERAETYVRLLAEAELRRAGDELRALDAALGTDWTDPGMEPFRVGESAHWRVIRAGRILAAAGALDWDFLDRFAHELFSATTARSRIHLIWYRRRHVLHTVFARESGQTPASGPAGQVMRVTPIERTLRVPGERGPSVLHLMSLVRTRTDAMITVVMRIHGSLDRTAQELYATMSGPGALPYDQLWATDEHGSRYTVRFKGGHGGTATWLGIAELSPVPPRAVRRLDLVGDGTLLVRLALRPSAAPGRAVSPITEPAAASPGERLLLLAAERILAGADPRRPVESPVPAQGPVPGEIITVLTEAGAIAADTKVPGQLAALCQRLGVAGHGITVPPAAQIPAPWASVIARRNAPVPAGDAEVYIPLAEVLEVDGARFALAGLSTSRGQSYLHVAGSGMPALADWFAWNWKPGFSWWLADGAGNWHVATAAEPWTVVGEDTQVFRLRLTPPLVTVPDVAEVVVTGPATRVRATLPIGPAPARAGIR